MKISRAEPRTVEFKAAFNQDAIVAHQKIGAAAHKESDAAPQENPQIDSSKSSQKLMAMLSGNRALGTQELPDQIVISRRAAAKHIAELQRIGILRRIGPDKGGHWEILLR